MGLPRPPRHRADAKAIFVLSMDEAWDKEKIDAEVRALEEQKDGLGQTHPVVQYHAGATRYDITHALPYLDSHKAWQFEVRPLTMTEFAEVQDLLDRFGENRAFTRAAQMAFIKSSGMGAPSDLSACFGVSVQLPVAIGSAAYVASHPALLDTEKKPSGS